MIHRYKLGGLNIVLDVCSGSVHVVDEVAYDIIGMYEESTRAEICAAMLEKYAGRGDVTEADILDCCGQIGQLKESGKLFAPDTFEPIAGALKQKSANVVKALCLHVAHTCNLNCAYCFASQGKYHGDRAVMSFEVGRQALDFLIEHSGSRRNDRYRVDYAGSGSWEKIVPKFQKLVAARGGKNYYMRGTFTHANPDFLKDIEQMLDLGFTELSMEPVVCAPGDPAGLTESDLEIVKDQYEQLAALMLERRRAGKPFTFYHYMIDLTGGPCIYKRISGCGSGTEYMAVTPWGDLYPCHQFVGEEKFKLGDVWTGVTNTETQAEFAACNVYAHEECRDCWARLYCSGGCAANAYHATGSVRGVYESGCELFKKRMECAIMLEASKALENA